jgi:hemerythrin superfamily protein
MNSNRIHKNKQSSLRYNHKRLEKLINWFDSLDILKEANISKRIENSWLEWELHVEFETDCWFQSMTYGEFTQLELIKSEITCNIEKNVNTYMMIEERRTFNIKVLGESKLAVLRDFKTMWECLMIKNHYHSIKENPGWWSEYG